jgi:hypothetical protein
MKRKRRGEKNKDSEYSVYNITEKRTTTKLEHNQFMTVAEMTYWLYGTMWRKMAVVAAIAQGIGCRGRENMKRMMSKGERR